MELDREGYQRKAQLLAELSALAIEEENFGEAERCLKEAQTAIEDMRKQPL